MEFGVDEAAKLLIEEAGHEFDGKELESFDLDIYAVLCEAPTPSIGSLEGC